MNSSAEQLLERYHAAMVAADADAFADLYAPDGVHEFPFWTPQGIASLRGPDQIRDYYRPLWSQAPVVLDRVESVAVHRTADGELVDELVSTGTRTADGAPFSLPGLVILTARDGRISRVRDYMDLLGLQRQLGGDG